ncbi:hypothetical protein H6G06_16905 [Anabaena sphaerica FACHB-251]|uniref:Uncharacterized protein n=1 Tax=Anabaena sphaerica FACHB-251 TaxID=2692883 RepID=A0A926WIH7_9NOST|nr:hypothetical protein [Anabaena sphaerica]MBD2295113.1 hypothetical protein [Anabaena sphaerica FACHB-251]
MKIFDFFKPKPAQPTIESYGQASSGVEQEQIQSLMEWLFSSLLNAGYYGKSHLIWYNSDNDNSNTSVEREINKAMRQGEPVFLYRCGGRVSLAPNGYYWRMMDEHPSMRIYQLEVK